MLRDMIDVVIRTPRETLGETETPILEILINAMVLLIYYLCYAWNDVYMGLTVFLFQLYIHTIICAAGYGSDWIDKLQSNSRLFNTCIAVYVLITITYSLLRNGIYWTLLFIYGHVPFTYAILFLGLFYMFTFATGSIYNMARRGAGPSMFVYSTRCLFLTLLIAFLQLFSLS